ncbi:uncharacterized protein LOC135846210 [Planococcus citri]|uniref:uncharacterized protein LOC135846210 n=1 Tax=Planococcus citri TaxID=170843 RepID=UPI0031F8764B
MAFKMNIAFVFATVFCLQTLNLASAKPSPGGGCGCEGFEGGFGREFVGGGFGREFVGGFGGGCGPISPPISFLPVPQPVPIRVREPQRQSVTIPNIILALLPPNQKSHIAPRPIIRPPPVVLPLPQPFPFPIGGERCGCL